MVVLTVPAKWKSLTVREITKRMRRNDHLVPFLARETKRWITQDSTLEEIVERLQAEGEPSPFGREA